jgi:hypothetical protein
MKKINKILGLSMLFNGLMTQETSLPMSNPTSQEIPNPSRSWQYLVPGTILVALVLGALWYGSYKYNKSLNLKPKGQETADKIPTIKTLCERFNKIEVNKTVQLSKGFYLKKNETEDPEHDAEKSLYYGMSYGGFIIYVIKDEEIKFRMRVSKENEKIFETELNNITNNDQMFNFLNDNYISMINHDIKEKDIKHINILDSLLKKMEEEQKK